MLRNFKFMLMAIFAVCGVFGTQVSAATPSPQMIEQFKNLPKSEQQRLAKQYGIDPAMLSGAGSASTTSLETPELLAPRTAKTSQTSVTNDNQQGHAFSKDNEIKRFGYELFAGAPTTFAPVSDAPVPAEYLVGPGDTIKVQLYGKENQSYDLIINREGVLQFPELGPVTVSGLTFEQLRESLAQRIKQQMIGIESNITMGELRSIRIFVAGDAYKPGSYTVSSLSTITQALFVAGGVNEVGSLRNIQLKRNGKLISRLDLYDILMRGDSSNDQSLRSGDVVFIPPVGGLITVKGKVRRPAIYELGGKETLADVVQMVGGLMPSAYAKNTILERYSADGLRNILNIDLTDTTSKKLRAIAGDSLEVLGGAEQYRSAITLVGAVARPGKYQWAEGKRLSDILPRIKGHVNRQADLKYGLIVRSVNESGDIQVIHFSLEKALSHSNVPDNVVLMPDDKVIIFNKNDDTQYRHELNRLVKQRVTSVEKFAGDSLLGADLFKAGFKQLESKGLAKKQQIAGVVVTDENDTEEQKLIVSGEVAKMLANLFDDPELLAVSGSMNRAELLYPVIVKLHQQGSAQSSLAIVAINGEVQFPGVYPLTKGAEISDLVNAAGGLKEGAYTQRAELTRTSVQPNGHVAQHLDIELARALTKSPTNKTQASKEFSLQSRDILTVMTTPDWQEHQTVEIRGEVRFPGAYNINRGETLANVIERAGGFTNYAYLPAAVFVRETVRQQEQIEIKKLANTLRRDLATRGVSKDGDIVNYGDAQLMLADLERIQAVGRLVVDLPALAMGVEQADLNMEDKDVLYIPSIRQTIAVMGEVQHAATHRYKEGYSLEEYIAMSGGSKKRADDDRIYIIQANGSVLMPSTSYWFDGHETLKPGDTIIVPLDTEYKDSLTLWSQVTQVIYNVAVAVAAVGNI